MEECGVNPQGSVKTTTFSPLSESSRAVSALKYYLNIPCVPKILREATVTEVIKVGFLHSHQT